ncbi:phosphatidylinositol N-acetylglucosaminyltransferase subunit P [Teleopsis dalmanni]|uniref:phosphatidylinositol N-acetylglucosaminyltransferase subunit P n=1 Tax=Teleopsis dalmanni TaxID=139649 RepID=UPI0018CF2255|nr:phosphatidylinositol N-acetylglucosaminyltransferase subunit P [Teleopsis dalmanni]
MPSHTPAPSPHRAVYGFAIYLFFFTLFILYFLWALLPNNLLKSCGIDFMPNKYFSICLPMLVLMGLFFFAFFIYPAINLSMTANVDELASVVDVSLLPENCRNSWKDIHAANKTVKSIKKTKDEKNPCAVCKETHQPAVLTQIATLRFLDLSDVNRNIFG